MGNPSYYAVDELAERLNHLNHVVMSEAIAPDSIKARPIFSVARSQGMLAKSDTFIRRTLVALGRRRKSDGVAPPPLQQVDLRALVQEFRIDTDLRQKPAAVTAVLSLKGGVAKSTTALHLAHFCALLDQRVMLADIDPQATSTAYAGLNPDLHISQQDTLHDVFVNGETDIGPLIRSVQHIDALDYIPSCSDLAQASELAFGRMYHAKGAAELAEAHGIKLESDPFTFWTTLRDALAPQRGNYQHIILDCPPQISAITYAAAFAADVIICPLGASMNDLSSTGKFLTWLSSVNRELGRPDQLVKFLITNYDNSQAASFMANLARGALGDHLLQNYAVHSSEIQRAGADLKSIYECHQASGSRDAWSRAVKSMDSVNVELASAINQFRRQQP